MDNSKIEIWKERIQACKASGLSVLQYCKNNHLSKGQYYYWHKIINEPTTSSVSQPVFAEVLAQSDVLSSYEGIKINYKNVEISISSKKDIPLAVELIHALQSQC